MSLPIYEYNNNNNNNNSGKVKVHPRTRHEGPEGGTGMLYSFFRYDARWGGWSTSCPGRLTPGKEPLPLV
jgi:hypothetical protein